MNKPCIWRLLSGLWVDFQQRNRGHKQSGNNYENQKKIHRRASMQMEITVLEKKMDKLIAAAGKSEKPKVAKKSQSKIRPGKNHPENSGEKNAYKKDNSPADCNWPGVTDYQQIEERG